LVRVEQQVRLVLLVQILYFQLLPLLEAVLHLLAVQAAVVLGQILVMPGLQTKVMPVVLVVVRLVTVRLVVAVEPEQ
jgi:hypothetical protein